MLHTKNSYTFKMLKIQSDKGKGHEQEKKNKKQCIPNTTYFFSIIR